MRNEDHFMNHVDIKTDNTLEKHGYEPIKSISLHEVAPLHGQGEQFPSYVRKRRGTDGVNAAIEQ